MSIQTRQVTVNLFDNDGSVIDNARVVIRLVGLGNEPGGAVSQGEQVKHTNENGVAVFTLWENNGTYSNTYYEVQSWHPERGNQIHRRERFLVPDHDADLEDLIAFGLAGVDPNLALLAEMQDIHAQTNSAAQLAQGSANLSQESADDAAGFAANSQTSALNSAASATASANSATSAAGSASSAATNATAASTSATQAATSATSAASSATAAGTSATSANTAATTAGGHSASAAGSAAAAADSASASEVSATAANSFSNTASSFAVDAQSYSLDAQNHAIDANSSKNDAETAATAAAGSATAAAGSATAANNSASLAQNWANEDEDVVVSGGEYSAKHYAAKAAESVAGNVIAIGFGNAGAGSPVNYVAIGISRYGKLAIISGYFHLSTDMSSGDETNVTSFDINAYAGGAKLRPAFCGASSGTDPHAGFYPGVVPVVDTDTGSQYGWLIIKSGGTSGTPLLIATFKAIATVPDGTTLSFSGSYVTE